MKNKKDKKPKKSCVLRIGETEYLLAQRNKKRTGVPITVFIERAIRETYANDNIILDRHNPASKD